MGRIAKKKAIDEDVLSLARNRVSVAFERFDTVSFKGPINT